MFDFFELIIQDQVNNKTYKAYCSANSFGNAEEKIMSAIIPGTKTLKQFGTILSIKKLNNSKNIIR